MSSEALQAKAPGLPFEVSFRGVELLALVTEGAAGIAYTVGQGSLQGVCKFEVPL